jgi:hypothetical protein
MRGAHECAALLSAPLGRSGLSVTALAGENMSIILLIAVIIAFGYYLSLKIHPTTRCKRCFSGNRHYDLMYSERVRSACPNCHGTGRQRRLGARLFIGSK